MFTTKVWVFGNQGSNLQDEVVLQDLKCTSLGVLKYYVAAGAHMSWMCYLIFF